MKSRQMALFTLCVLLGLPALRAKADDRSEIVALYHRLEVAQKAQSASGTLALLAPNFSYKSGDGKTHNAQEFVDQMKMQMKLVKRIRDTKMKVTKVVINGKRAKVTNDFAWSMEIEDTAKPGQLHVMASTGSVENELEKTSKGWKFLTLRTVSGKMTMDGHPIHPPTAAK